MRFSPPPFAGPDAPPPFAAAAATAFGLATLAAAVASGSGPDAAEAFPALLPQPQAWRGSFSIKGKTGIT